MSKRILAWLLAACTLLTTAACGSGGSATDTTDTTTAADTTDTTAVPDDTTADTEPEYEWTQLSDNLETVDFEGEELIIYAGFQQDDYEISAMELKSDAVSDSQYHARVAVENRFNAKIVLTVHEVTSLFKDYVTVGEDTRVVGKEMGSSMMGLMQTGYLLDLGLFEQFDFSREWYFPSNDQLAVGNKYFVISSLLAYTAIARATPLMVNMDMAAQYHITLPYDKVFAGEWYMDDWMELVSVVHDDTDGDGEIDRFGWAFERERMDAFQTSAGIQFIQKDENNNPIFNDDSEKALRYTEKLEQFIATDAVLETIHWGIYAWKDGLTLMSNPTLNRVIRDIIPAVDYAFAYLPNPKLDEFQEDYMYGVYDHYWGMPVSNIDNMDFCATIVEALQCAHYNTVLPTYLETMLKGRFAESPEDAQVLSMIPGCIYLSSGCAIGSDSMKLDNLLMHGKDGKAASTIASMSKSLPKQIKSYLKKIDAISEDQQ